ncbi:MAG: carboxylate--amine ligase/circularly permuted type 2 ATP-grasp protein, partial [Herbiconiux sp.]|nr:carboxylate--amine ligase/circularly permuted type 2 ATP-grasp protein [Herbiconiux sp.]
PLHRAAMWQAARGGLTGDLLDDTVHPRPTAAAHAVRHLIRRLRPQLEELGDHAEVVSLAETLLARGNSADRQRAAFAERGELDAVVKLVVDETHGPAAGPPPAAPALRTYRTRAGDEAVGPGSRPRPAYEKIVGHYEQLEPGVVGERMTAARDWAASHDLAFRVDGELQPFAVDLVPRLISGHEWRRISSGLVQRARALEAFLADVYGEQRILQDGVIPRTDVEGAPGWHDAGREVPAGTVRAAVFGFDLVRTEFGSWRVLEDNLRNPSGAAYAVAIRELIDAVAPEVPRPEGLLDPGGVFGTLRSTLLAGGRRAASLSEDTAHQPAAALLSSGPRSSAWFEHRVLAEGAGLDLLTLDDLAVHDGVVVHREGGDRLHALYLRLDDELPEARDGSGAPLGRAIMDVAAAGKVFLANAPGNGVADDKAVYCTVPSLIAYYLDERPELEQVPTYRTSDEAERRAVLERVGELVTKPVDGHGGSGVLIGPAARAAEVAERRAAIAASPADWVAQEVVALSSHPTFVRTEGAREAPAAAPGSPQHAVPWPVLEPRHVDLRVFVYATGDGEFGLTVADLALTRVAPAGSMVVNSSRGGGSKD